MGVAVGPVSEQFVRKLVGLERRLALMETRWARLAGNPVILQNVTLTASAASMDFTGIPQNFAHLQINCYMRSDFATGDVASRIRINGDTGANYDSVTIWANGPSPSAFTNLAETSAFIGTSTGATAPAGQFGGVQIAITHYAQAANRKNIMTQWGTRRDAVGNMSTGQTSAFWSTAAITSLSLFPQAGNFVAGSRATLIGIP